nr:DNA repair protein RAD52 homolog isoform X1 [Pseudochaenichthys georgianus]XP_033940137.1 DNA repair protein RAD52 homolog isoform X1 [Pseudochaenichthys georgianus]
MYALSKRRRETWLNRIGREDLKPSNHNYTRVCGDHFTPSKPVALFDKNHPDWAPSVKLGHEKITAPSPATHARYKRARKRSSIAPLDLYSMVSDIPSPEEPAPVLGATGEEEGMIEPETGTATQTDLTGEMIDKMSFEINNVTTENVNLKEKLVKSTISESTFKGDDDRVRFYTGLPTFAILMMVYNLVELHISVNAKSSLSKFQQFILTLMKLRLNQPLQELAYKFNTSTSTVSRVFTLIIDVMFKRMSFLLKWPSREELQLTMPMDFRTHFGTKVAVIIDCFEVFIDRPSNVMARAQTWSNYKHHNTITFLIGICPQGVISFISRAWGGRSSDKHITESCGFLDNILPGDLILADRGFNISDSVGFMCAEVKVPAFMKGRKQLSMKDVIDTRKIANVRIHVERVIGCVRQRYTVLGGPIPIDFLLSKDVDGITLMDKIAEVCCDLNNVCDTVIPVD